MSKLEPHPLSKLFPQILPEDFDKLAGDIKLHGLHHPIVLYQGKILDGNNRYRACEDAKIAPKFTDFTGDDAQARNYVISANIHRRHLDRETRTKIVTELLRADPTKSDRQIATTAKVDNKTVASIRGQMEATEEIPQLESTTGADGKSRKRKGGKPKGKGSGKGSKAITFQEVTDGKTARNAYHVLEEHLLDALQEINDRSSFDHADEYAQATIEKLQAKLSEMQPEMADAAE
jgi:ParB-like chromosome segregation protein Spo0J